MPTVSGNGQMWLPFEPGLVERWPTLKAYMRYCVHTCPSGKSLKQIAADMDLSQSELTRKLADNPNDPRSFDLDDLEKYVETQDDDRPSTYLAQKRAKSQESAQAYAVERLTVLLPEIAELVQTAKGVQVRTAAKVRR
jgi:hypothetical protein